MQTNTVQHTIEELCLEFLDNPYLCYSEHCLHARFYSLLLDRLRKTKQALLTDWKGNKVCVVQKEYRTGSNLGKSEEQHWDISVIRQPAICSVNRRNGFDYLDLHAAVEFGLNQTEEHLLDDNNRLCHPDVKIEQRFIVHLYRLIDSGYRISCSDISPSNTRYLRLDKVCQDVDTSKIAVYYGVFYAAPQRQKTRVDIGLWRQDGQGRQQLQ